MASFQTNDGVELFYEDVGSGKPMVLVHGWTASHRSFRYQVEHFKKIMRVISIDLRGHGDSQKPQFGYRISRLAKDLDDLLTALNLKDITLLGWSMGCSVIWSYIDLFGLSKVSRLIFVDEPVYLMNVLGHELGMVTPNEAVDFVENFLRKQNKEYAANLALSTEQTSEEKEELASKSLATLVYDHFHNDWRDVVRRIDVPTFVVGAKKSHINWRSQVWIHEHIPGSEILIFEDGGHLIFYEEPKKFNDAVESFIASSK